MRRSFMLFAVIALTVSAACGDNPDPADNNAEQNDDRPNMVGNDNNVDLPEWSNATDEPNALNRAGHDLLPWPADQYMDFEQSPARLTVDQALLPEAVTPSLIAGTGVSRLTPIVTRLPGGIDPRDLPDADDWGATLSDDSPVRVVVVTDNEEPQIWPVMAELDATADDPESAALLIRPHRPFPAGARVAVGLRTDLKTYGCFAEDQGDAGDGDDLPDCANHSAADALSTFLSPAPDAPPEGALRGWLGDPARDLAAALPMLGPDADDLAQAWTFTVRSDEEVTDPLIQMQQIAADADTSEFSLEPVEYDGDKALIYGTVGVPWFLDDDDLLVLDDQGAPVVQETRDVPFLITIPDTVTAPRPVVLFGHGFFSSIEEPTWNNLFGGLKQWEMPAVTTRFYGFSDDDLGSTAEALGGDNLEAMQGVIDLQRQSQTNFTVVHNLIADHLADTVRVDFGDGEISPLDPENIPYMGISNGGTQGLVMMSTSPVLETGALVVPGGGWSHMLQRASQWNSLGLLFSNRYDSDDELQVAMAMLQQVFDPVDSLNYVDHLIDDRLPDLPADPSILLVEAVNDAQVANLVTRWIVGTAGVPVITPSVAEVWGAPTIAAADLDDTAHTVGFESYDLGVADNPSGNVAPTENDVHDNVRRLDSYREQMGLFLEEGRLIRTCDGPCLVE